MLDTAGEIPTGTIVNLPGEEKEQEKSRPGDNKKIEGGVFGTAAVAMAGLLLPGTSVV